MNLINQVILFFQSFVLALTPMPTYTEGVLGQPVSFFPSKSSFQADRTVSKLIYRGLFKYDIYGSLVPDLADNWSISEDGMGYTIKLKDDQYWSDGSKITSNDIIYTSFKVGDLSGVATDRIDELTVRFTLPNKFSPFLSMLTVGIMKDGSEETNNGLLPISNGNFRVMRIEKNGPLTKQVVLTKVNVPTDKKLNYCEGIFAIPNEGGCKIRKIVIRYFENEEEMSVAAKLGEIDGFVAYNEHEELENFSNYKFPLQGVYYAIFFNTRNDKLKDTAIRQKLEKVLPIQDIISSKGISVQGPISRSIYTERSIVEKKPDLSFKEDLSSTQLILTIPNTEAMMQIAEEVKRHWRENLNIDVTIRKIDQKNFLNEVVKPRNFEVMIYGQEIGRDPDRYVNWYSTQEVYPGLNFTGFSQVRADRALEEGRNFTEFEERLVHYREFQKVIADQVPVVFLYHPYTNYYISKYVRGLGDKYTFDITDRFLDFENWERIITN